MITNLILSLLVSTNVMLHWEPSPDTSVVAYHVYGAHVSRFTNQWVPGESTPPAVGTNRPPSVVRGRSVRIGTNTAWVANEATHWRLGNVTNWIVPEPWASTRSFWSVTASDDTEFESDLSNEVLLVPRWLWVSFAVEGSRDMTNWTVLGQTNLFRVWRPTDSQAFLRGRIVVAP